MFVRCLLLFVGFAGASLNARAIDLDREIVFATQAGSAREDAEIRRWQERANAATAKSAEYGRLGWAFVAKARRTLDAGYYKLAEKTADVMDTEFGASAESRLLRGHVFHNLHRFAEAEQVARALVRGRGLAVDLGLLSDVLMEQGKLGEAVEVLQRMVNFKPGAEALSRVAHLRWLKGDLAGAIAAMREAELATAPQETEAAAWMIVRLSDFALQSGDAVGALALADSAERRVADYAPALLARGRALLALRKDEDAVPVLSRAVELNPLPEYQWWLADALRAVGRLEEAKKVETKLGATGEASDPRTYALFLIAHGGDQATALRLVREEIKQRGDVFTHDALAAALLATGDAAAAEIEIEAALAEGTKDARLFLHAGEIFRARGNGVRAGHFFEQARAQAATLTPSERQRLVMNGPPTTQAFLFP